MQHTTPPISSTLKKAGAALTALLCVVAVIVLVSAPKSALAVTAAEKQAEAEEALANLNAMQETLDRLSAEYGEALAAQEAAEASRDAAEQRINELNVQITDIQDRLGERAREMYRSGGVSFLEILLGATSFEEFATTYDAVNKFNQSDADLIEQQRALKAEAEEQAAIYDAQATIAAEKSAEAEEAAEQAQATVAEMQATYDSLSEEAARLLEEERAAQEAAEAARAAQIVAESAAAATNEGGQSADNGGQNAGGGSNNGGASDPGENGGSSDPSGGGTADTPSYEGGSDTVSRAYACLGAPYVWGGVGPDGYDCSGLVSYCLTGSHSRLGTTYTFMDWPQVSDPQPGDICVNWGHTGVYIGDGQMIHAATYGVGVIVGPVQSGMIIVRYGG